MSYLTLTIGSVLFMLFLWGLTIAMERRAKERKLAAEKNGDKEAAAHWRRHYLED